MTLGSSKHMSYTELLLAFTPRPIRTETQYSRTQAVVDQLIDKGDLTEDERDYLNMLGTLMYEYEEQTVHIPDIYGVQMLKVLIEEFELRQKDLTSIFKTESIVSEVLNKRRSLTVEHIQKLAQFFNVSPAVCFELESAESKAA